MSNQLLQETITWIVIIICLVIVFFLQYRTFGTSGKTRTPNDIASFFSINEIVDKWQRAVFATVTSIPLTFVFLIVAYRAEVFIEALPTDASTPFVQTLIRNIPEPLLPIVILIMLFLIFGAQTKFLYQKIEKGIVHLAAFVQKTNSLSRNLSRYLLTMASYERIVEELERNRPNKLPMAEELEEAKNELKLSFLLLHMAKYDVREIGLRAALRQIVELKLEEIIKLNDDTEKDYPWEERVGLLTFRGRKLNWFHLFASAMMFLIVCGLYIGIVPSGWAFFEARDIVWPEYQYIGSLVHGVVQMVLATILPMIIGIFLFVWRTERRRETVVQTVSIVLVIVFLTSLVINAPFAFQQRLEIFLGIGELQPTNESGFGGRAELFYVFVHSLIPCAVVLVLAIVDPEETLSFWDIVITVVVIALGHGLAYAAFERLADIQWNFYWHQALLSIVLSTSVLVILRIFWRAPLQPRSSSLPNSNSTDG